MGVSVDTFQGRIPKGEKRYGRYDWGHKYSPVRVLCFVPTLWPTKEARVDMIRLSYGKYCTRILFVLCESEKPPTDDPRLLVVSCDYPQAKGYRNIWNKVMYMWY